MGKKRGRPSVADLYGSDETVTVKITLTKEQHDFLTKWHPAGVGAFIRSITDLAMRVHAGDMPDEYDPEFWRHFDEMIVRAMEHLDEERGGR